MTAIEAREPADGGDFHGRRLAKWSPHDRRLAERSEAWRRRRSRVSASYTRRPRPATPRPSRPRFPLYMTTPPANRSHEHRILSDLARRFTGMTAIEAHDPANGGDFHGRRLAKWSPHDRRLAERSEAWRRRRSRVSARSAQRSRRRTPMSSRPRFPLCMNTPPANRSRCASNLVRTRA